METGVTTPETSVAKRPRWRRPLVIVACLTLYSGCDTIVGPGLVTGGYDQARYALITSQLRVGESKADAIRAFSIGLTKPQPIGAEPPDYKSGIGATFLQLHGICFASEQHLRVVIDKADRVQSWDTTYGGDYC